MQDTSPGAEDFFDTDERVSCQPGEAALNPVPDCCDPPRTSDGPLTDPSRLLSQVKLLSTQCLTAVTPHGPPTHPSRTPHGPLTAAISGEAALNPVPDCCDPPTDLRRTPHGCYLRWSCSQPSAWLLWPPTDLRRTPHGCYLRLGPPPNWWKSVMPTRWSCSQPSAWLLWPATDLRRTPHGPLTAAISGEAALNPVPDCCDPPRTSDGPLTAAISGEAALNPVPDCCDPPRTSDGPLTDPSRLLSQVKLLSTQCLTAVTPHGPPTDPSRLLSQVRTPPQADEREPRLPTWPPESGGRPASQGPLPSAPGLNGQPIEGPPPSCWLPKMASPDDVTNPQLPGPASICWQSSQLRSLSLRRNSRSNSLDSRLLPWLSGCSLNYLAAPSTIWLLPGLSGCSLEILAGEHSCHSVYLSCVGASLPPRMLPLLSIQFPNYLAAPWTIWLLPRLSGSSLDYLAAPSTLRPGNIVCNYTIVNVCSRRVYICARVVFESASPEPMSVYPVEHNLSNFNKYTCTTRIDCPIVSAHIKSG